LLAAPVQTARTSSGSERFGASSISTSSPATAIQWDLLQLGHRGSDPFGPTLEEYATDYRYDSVNQLVALDLRLPGDKSSTRSYIMFYRGPGILLDGAQGSFGVGQTTATIIYYLGAIGRSGQFPMMQVNVYQGALAPLGPYLGFARGTNPRFASIW
jgi:hypothetical protein